MPKVKVYNIKAEACGNMTLSDEVFATPYKEALIHDVVVAYLANQRQGNKSTLTRSEVRGHHKKPWAQKHTGRARHGDTKAPQFTGGGVVFAPKPREYSKKINKKESRLALFSALTSKLQDEKLIVVDSLAFDAPKTKEFVKVLENIKASKALVVLEGENENVVLSARNIPDVDTEVRTAINVYDILKHDSLVMTKDAVKALEEVYA